MPTPVGTMLIKITADIADLKKGVAQAKAEIQSLKDESNSGGGLAGWGGMIGNASTAMRSLVGGTAAFLGVAISVYGILNLWWSAVNGFVSLMTTAIGTVDEFKMGIVSTAGMMTAITDRSVEPNLDKAYGEWKTYLDWLYRASLETDRKVASGGAEIFETAKQLAIRGIVPNDKDQVYTVGLLSDFIKTVTQGLSQRQQLIQEVRAMFEGAMRPGAQALAQFVAIDPDFKEKFEEARAAAISMKDATPIFDLLRETLKGMTFAATDTQNTFESLSSTAKSAFSLLMIEAFGSSYEEIVKVGWALMDVFYKEGQLTEEGKRLAFGLVDGWNKVKGAVFEFVEYIRNNPEVVNTFVQNLVNGLSQAFSIALKLGNAIVWLLEKFGSISLVGGDLDKKYNEVMKKSGETAGTSVEDYKANTPWYSKLNPFASTGIVSDDQKRAAIAKYDKDVNDLAVSYTQDLEKLGGQYSIAGNQFIKTTKEVSGKTAAAMDKALSVYKPLPDIAPEHPFAKIPAGKDKEDKGGAGRTPSDAELLKKYNDALRDLEKTRAEEEFKNFKEFQDLKKHELTLSLHQGTIDIQTYYNKLEDMARDNWLVEADILEQRKVAAQKAYEENLKAIDLKASNRDLTSTEVELLKGYEKLKLDKEIFKVNQEIGRLGIKSAKELADIDEKRLKTAIEIAKINQESTWDLMKLSGPVGEMAAKLQQIEQDYYNKVYSGAIPPPGQTWTGYRPGPGGQLQAYPVSGDEALNQMKAKQWEAQWGRFTREAADAIAAGFTDMVEALITGTQDWRQAAQRMFKSLFNIALKPGLESLVQSLKKAFDKMFQGIGEQVAMSALAVIALVAMMLLNTKKSSEFSPSGVESQVTGHEAVRGVIAGETSIPIAQISNSLQDAMTETNSILNRIERNTRGLGALQLDLKIDIPGLKDSIAKAMEDYFASYAQTMGK